MGLSQQQALAALKLAIGPVHQGVHQGPAKRRIHPEHRQLHHQHQQLVIHLEGIGNEQVAHPLEGHLPGAPLLQTGWLQPGQQPGGRLVVLAEKIHVIHQLQLLPIAVVGRQTLLYAAAHLTEVRDGLEQKVAGAGTQRPFDRLHLALGRDNDDRGMRITGRETGDHLMAIHVGHVQVTQDNIGVVKRGGGETFDTVFSLEDAGAIVLEIIYQGVAKNDLVFHH